MKIAILTNGSVDDNDFYQSKLQEYDFIICADGGLVHAYNMGVLPHLALGDFDSTPPNILDYYRLKGCEIIQYSRVKDETDTELALTYALKKAPERVDILAGLGSRFDHSLANVHLLKKSLEYNIPSHIITQAHEISLVDSFVEIQGHVGDGISLLPLTASVKHIFTKGLAYPIVDGLLEIGKPYGISNYMTKPLAHIKIGSGLLLVIKYFE